MPKETKAAVALSKLSDADKRLCSKLITTLQDTNLDPQSRNSIKRAINKARREPNFASPQSKKKYANAYVTFYKERFTEHRNLKSNEQIDVTDIAKLIGAEWQALEESAKRAYEDMAAKERV